MFRFIFVFILCLSCEGQKGSQGKIGIQGDQGDRGEQGLTPTTDGLKGDQGPVGPKGDSGPKGDRGLVGPKGSVGGGCSMRYDSDFGYIYECDNGESITIPLKEECICHFEFRGNQKYCRQVYGLVTKLFIHIGHDWDHEGQCDFTRCRKLEND
jgi:hypothetical protein